MKAIFTGTEQDLIECGFVKKSDSYVRYGKRDVFVYKYNWTIAVYKKDNTTYTGYAYKNEYKHNTKHYIQDLIDKNLVRWEK